MEQDNLEEEPKIKGKDKKSFVIIIIAVVIGIVAGTAGTFIGNMISTKVHGKPTVESVEEKFNENETSVPLDEFLVNLAEGKNGEMMYIRIKLSLLTGSEKNVEIINTSKDMIRDSIVNKLRQKNAENILSDKNGVNNLKKELQEQINTDYGSALVREIFITDLVIQ